MRGVVLSIWLVACRQPDNDPPRTSRPPLEQTPEQRLLEQYAPELSEVGDRLEDTWKRCCTDGAHPVYPMPSPATGTALARRENLLEVTAQFHGVGISGPSSLRGSEYFVVCDSPSASEDSIAHGRDTIFLFCGSEYSDRPDAVELRLSRELADVRFEVNATISATGVCANEDARRYRTAHAELVRVTHERVGTMEHALFGYAEDIIAGCAGGPPLYAPPATALEQLPGYVGIAGTSCEHATRPHYWYTFPNRPEDRTGVYTKGPESYRGTYRPSNGSTIIWKRSTEPPLDLLEVRLLRADGELGYFTVQLRPE